MVDIVYIDGTDKVLGRMASVVAKMALQGKKIIIVNCEMVSIIGSKDMIIDYYTQKIRMIGGRHKGPFWPRRPDDIVRRTISRMLPFTRERGKKALKRIEVYIGLPKEYAGKTMTELKIAERPVTNRYIYVGQLSEKIGSTRWK